MKTAAVRRLARSLAALAVVGLFARVPAAEAFKFLEEGQKAPDFSATDLAGQPVRLLEKAGGAKALALVFWAGWSPRSKPMLDDLSALAKEREGKGFEVLTVNVEHEHPTPEEVGAIRAFAAAWSFPVVLDEGLALYSRYGVVATPSLAVLDATGTIRYVSSSYSSGAREELRDTVDGLLGIARDKAVVLAIKKRDYVPPKKATLHYQKAEVLIQRGMGKKAVKDLEEAATLDPQWPEPRIALAAVYTAEAHKQPALLAKAETLLKEARDIRPRHVRTLASLAEVWVRQGRYEEAVAVADEALGIDRSFTPALLAKARSLVALKKFEAAGAAADEALALDPRSPELLAVKADVLAGAGDWKQAAELLRKAVEIGFARSAGGVP